ncbi:MAG: hypothetical protein M0Q91_12545 [Methanoregula sp.]|nr:hypothetical protein [Methanoregula sp.]
MGKTRLSCSTIYCEFFDCQQAECSFKNIVLIGGQCTRFNDIGEGDRDDGLTP